MDLWRQIGETLSGEIANGVLSPGRRLPACTKLAARFGVNRHTVLRAISHLKDEGLVRVEQGRGTYVVEAPFNVGLGPRQHFEHNVLRANKTPLRTVLSVVELPAPEVVAQKLDIAAGEPVALVVLVGQANTTPINFVRNYFPLSRQPGIASIFREFGPEPTAKLSFREVFKQVGVDDFRRGSIKIESRTPRSDEARLLKMPLSEHVLVTEVTNVDAEGTPVVYALTSFPSSRVRLSLDP